MSRLFIPDSRARRARGAYLFVEESTGRMLPGYRAKAVASYSVKFISSIEGWGGGGGNVQSVETFRPLLAYIYHV